MWLVVGHDQAVQTLRSGLAAQRLAHAYLVVGPPQVGKGRLALDLARALNCAAESVEARPCGACRPCRLIEAGGYADVEVIGLGGLCDEREHDHHRDASRDIKICQVRRLQRTIALRPYEGRTRVLIVDPAEAMNLYAADAFLKTLEEPPGNVVLILLAGREEALPETIISRCRRITLAPLPRASVERELLRRGVDQQRAEVLARLSEGRLGWALANSENQALLSQRSERLDRIEALSAERRAGRLTFAAELGHRFTRDRQDVYAYLDLLLRWWRDVLLVGEGCDQLVSNTDRVAGLKRTAAATRPASVVAALQALRECRQHLEANANARLALEVLCLRLPGPESSSNTDEEAGRRRAGRQA